MNGSTRGGGPNITHLLSEVRERVEGSEERLYQAVSRKLRDIAGSSKRRFGTCAELLTTALADDAFLNLCRGGKQSWRDRGHFYRAAAKAMQRLLIDHVRAMGRDKRTPPGKREHGGDLSALDEIAASLELDQDSILDLADAIDTLESWNPVEADVVRLRFFTGRTHREVAEILGLRLREVELIWIRARCWLRSKLS